MFVIPARDDFMNDRSYAGLMHGWRSNGTFLENMRERVAPNVSISGISGYTIRDNCVWENRSYLSGKYEKSVFMNVEMKGGKYEGFERMTWRGHWMVKERGKDIVYGAGGLPENAALVARDIGGNELRQRVTDIRYMENPDQGRHMNLVMECENKMGREGYYGCDAVAKGINPNSSIGSRHSTQDAGLFLPQKVRP